MSDNNFREKVFKNVYMPARTAFKNFLLRTYYKNYYRKLEDLLYIYKADNFKLVRIGADHDGGYIMLDDFVTWGGGYHIHSELPQKFHGTLTWQNAAIMCSCMTTL